MFPRISAPADKKGLTAFKLGRGIAESARHGAGAYDGKPIKVEITKVRLIAHAPCHLPCVLSNAGGASPFGGREGEEGGAGGMSPRIT